MTKTKKLNKIIPAVLLSGAMLMPVSQLTSPIVANALENSNSKIYLSTLKFKTESKKQNLLDANYTYGDNIEIVSGSSIIVDLNRKYSELDTDLATHHDDISPLKFEFIVDGKLEKEVTIQAGTGELGSTMDAQHVNINNLDNANKLEIKVSNDDNSPYAFFGELEHPTLTKK